jgi:two-component sensor histidine kinase
MFNQERLKGYGLGAGCVLAAFALRHFAGPWFQLHYPYLTYFCAVILTAYLAGFWPALAVGVVSALTALATYSPTASILSETPTSPYGAGIFFVMGTACAAVIASLRTARDRLEIERKRYADLAESRDLLYRELQHRVSNNIQVVAGLLMVQAATASPSGRKTLAEASLRIGLIAKIQRELHNQAGTPTPFCDFARELLADAVNAAGAQDVSVVVTGGAEPLHPDQATAVSLVLLECFNNALEHAYAEGRGGTVQVSLTQDGGLWRMIVRDDGPGPPGDLDIGRSASLGLKIVRAMAGQLHGEFSITNSSPGAVCELTYPVLD